MELQVGSAHDRQRRYDDRGGAAAAVAAARRAERDATVICDVCGQDRVREDCWLLAFFRVGWPPVKLKHACPGCREKLPFARLHRVLFLACCLALMAAVVACGFGIVHLIKWLTSASSAS
jgi:hypothetical protein